MDKNPNLKANKPKKEHKEKNFYDVYQVKKSLDVLENESIKQSQILRNKQVYQKFLIFILQKNWFV